MSIGGCLILGTLNLVCCQMRNWFTADQHLGHIAIIKHCSRPFQSTWEMQETIIRNFNAKVAPEDTVYHLGDIFWGLPHGPTLARLNGHHKLVPGNHDKCHPMKGKHAKAKEYYESLGFEVLEPQVEMHFPLLGQVLLSHFPAKSCVASTDPHIDVKYPEWRPGYNGIIICGHVHNHWKTRHKCINVGVDVWDFAPVPETMLQPLVEAIK